MRFELGIDGVFSSAAKIDTYITFPIDELDITKYIVDQDGKKTKYDLFAVSNHIGGLNGGHYTAFCKNHYTDKWYKFNDKKYLIHSIAGYLEFHNNIKACLGKKKEIGNEIKELFGGAKINNRNNKKHPADKSGKSKFWSFDITLKSGAWASVGCTDWSEEMYKAKKWTDVLQITVRSEKFTEFLRKYY